MWGKKKKGSLSFWTILIIIVLILPMNIYMLYSAQRSQEIIIQQTVTGMESMANLYMNELEDQMRTINNFVLELEESDVNLQSICKEADWDSYYISGMGLLNTMRQHIANYKDANAYFFYSDNTEHGMLVENAENVSKSQLEDVLFDNENILQSRRWQIITIDDTQWLFHANYWRGIYIGAGIQLDYMVGAIQENMENETLKVFFDDRASVKDGEGFLSVTKQCAERKLYLHLQVEEQEVIQNLPILQRMGFRFAFAQLCIIPIMILVVRGLILVPLQTLNEALQRLKSDPTVRISRLSLTPDFENVYSTFNNMADEIVELKINNYEREIDRQKMELRNLQMQVKPHFLFNSLNLMYNLIQMREYKSVQTMLLYFSDYFRYINVGDNDFSLFGEELELIKKYIEVSKIRYPNIIEEEYQVEAGVETVMIPQLLVHNFVENIIKHGLNLKQINHILLKAYVEDGQMAICIQDDGVGMPEEQAENVNQGIFVYADGAKHHGLKNSYRRMHYFYGEKGSMRIRSAIDQGTEVVLRFPAENSGGVEIGGGRQ